MNNDQKIQQLERQVAELTNKVSLLENEVSPTFSDTFNTVKYVSQNTSVPATNGYVVVEINGLFVKLMRTA